MNLKELEKLREWRDYIETLESEIIELSSERVTTDTVSGSMTEYPYTKHCITIHGVDVHSGEDKLLREKIKMLHEARNKAHQAYAEIMNAIDMIQEPFVKNILILKFVTGQKKTWQDVARIMGCVYSEDYLRIKASRELEKIKKK